MTDTSRVLEHVAFGLLRTAVAAVVAIESARGGAVGAAGTPGKGMHNTQGKTGRQKS